MSGFLWEHLGQSALMPHRASGVLWHLKKKWWAVLPYPSILRTRYSIVSLITSLSVFFPPLWNAHIKSFQRVGLASSTFPRRLDRSNQSWSARKRFSYSPNESPEQSGEFLEVLLLEITKASVNKTDGDASQLRLRGCLHLYHLWTVYQKPGEA